MHTDARALLIDGMGTLVSLVDPAPRLVAVVRRRFGATVSEVQARAALRAEITFYRAHMNEGRDSAALAALHERCAEQLFGALPVGVADAVAGDAAGRTAALLEALQFAPFHDARDALARARAHGARVVVVSNWDVSLAEVLERVGLAPLVDGVVTSAALGAPKPSPAIFEHALALAGVSAADAVHVGDSVDEDVAGARGCGIRAILVCRDGRRMPGVQTISGLHELSWAGAAVHRPG